MGPDHLLNALLCLRFKIRIAHMLLRQAARMIFFPDKNTLLIAQIQEDLIVRIMRAADGIGAQILYDLQILLYRLRRKGAAEHRMIFVAAEALDAELFPVQQKIPPADGKSSEADPLDQVVHCGIILPERRADFIQCGVLRTPDHGTEPLDLSFRDPLLSCRDIDLQAACCGEILRFDADLTGKRPIREIDDTDRQPDSPAAIRRLLRDAVQV